MGLRQEVNMARINPARHGKVKTVALEHLRLDLRNRFEGLQFNEDASPEDDW